MDAAEASSTALATALMRALHTRLDRHPLLDDPWGERLVPQELRARFDEARLLRSPAFPNVITRSRYAEDALRAAVARGIGQYVLIGAGFDSFCVRRPDFAKELEIFEIDHPATQTLKVARIEECGITLAPNVHFIAADLSKVSLAQALAGSSFDSERLAFFSWLGVTMYLTREANLSTFRAIAQASPPGSELAYTYMEAARLQSPTPAFQEMQKQVSALSEPFLSGFDPATMALDAANCGLELIEDLTGAQALARYGRSNDPALARPSSSHVALARVAPRSSPASRAD